MRAIHSILVLVSLAAANSVGAQAVMIPLGDLPGGQTFSLPRALSGDGRFAVGHSSSSSGFLSTDAFVWSASTGMVALERALGSDSASGVSSDGRYIVGDTFNSTGNFGVLWEVDGAVHLIPDIPGGNTVSLAGDVSDTGVVVGSSQYAMGQFGPLSQAIRWTVNGGLVPMGFLNSSDTHSEAYAISADGSVIAGRGTSGNWMWTESTGMVATAGIEFESRGMTEDGSFILGRQRISVNGGTQLHAVIWSEDTGTIELDRSGFRSGTQLSGAIDATPGADVIVGSIDSVTFPSMPYIWFDRGATGMSLADYFRENGLDFAATGFHMDNIAGISDDGSRFLLETFNPDGNREAVLVIVPAPTSAGVIAALGLGALRRRR